MDIITAQIGSLLHDIGKLVHRKGVNESHPDLAANFILESQMIYDDIDKVVECVRYHHEKDLKTAKLKPDSLAYIVCEADNIAAGADRRPDGEGQFGFDAKLPIKSVFNNLRGNRNNICSSQQNTLYVRELSYKREKPTNIPTSNISATKDKYQYLFSLLNSILKNAQLEMLGINGLLDLLKQTMYYVPSSTKTDEIADVSLYCHSKLTAAFSAAMLHYIAENNIADYHRFYQERDVYRKKHMFTLTCFDISGIQDYIYTIKSNKAAKALRARSLTLEIFMEYIIDEFLNKAALSRTSLLYSGGGRAYLILPNTGQILYWLDKLKENVNDWFIDKFNTTLYFEQASVKCCANELMGKDERNTPAIFAQVSAEITKRKLKRYSPSQLNKLTNVSARGPQNRECSVCGESNDTVRKNDDVDICATCLALEELPINQFASFEDALMALKVVPQRKKGNVELPEIFGQPASFEIVQINRNQIINERIYLFNASTYNKNCVGLPFCDYLIPNNTFSDYAKSSTGIRRLGVLRADVDNLGELFAKGFIKEDYNTFSRTQTLSEALSLFFKCVVSRVATGNLSFEGDKELKQTLMSDNANKKKSLQVCYSGGDDLFIVGAWDHVIEFSVDLRNMFEKYTCGKITFSAGLGLFKSTFPVSQMARITGELESAAKSHTYNKCSSVEGLGDGEKERQKDSIALFDSSSVFTWKRFTENVLEEKLKFLRENLSLDDESKTKLEIGSSAIYKLLFLIRGIKKSGINYARLAYWLARNKPSNKLKLPIFEKFQKNIINWLDEKDELIMAITLFIYLNRKEG